MPTAAVAAAAAAEATDPGTIINKHREATCHLKLDRQKRKINRSSN